MFYDNTAITALVQRVGFAQAIPPTTIALSSANVLSTSGKRFKTYSAFASVEKINALMDNSKMDAATFQQQLEDYRKQAVYLVLETIYDENLLANQVENGLGYPVNISGTDYSGIIASRANVFDRCIGLQFAVMIIQMMITSVRSNGTERATSEAYIQLKMELEGANEGSNNAFAGKGLIYEMDKAYKSAIKILFPQPRTGLQNRSYLW